MRLFRYGLLYLFIHNIVYHNNKWFAVVVVVMVLHIIPNKSCFKSKIWEKYCLLRCEYWYVYIQHLQSKRFNRKSFFNTCFTQHRFETVSKRFMYLYVCAFFQFFLWNGKILAIIWFSSQLNSYFLLIFHSAWFLIYIEQL